MAQHSCYSSCHQRVKRLIESSVENPVNKQFQKIKAEGKLIDCLSIPDIQVTCVCESVFSILVGGNLDNVSIFDKDLFLNESMYLTFICLVLAGFNGKKRKENTVVMLESF